MRVFLRLAIFAACFSRLLPELKKNPPKQVESWLAEFEKEYRSAHSEHQRDMEPKGP